MSTDEHDPGPVSGAVSDAGGDGGVADESGAPDGGPLEWSRRGLALLDGGDAAAAAILLERAHAASPESSSLLEALGRAFYDSGRFGASADRFTQLVAAEPTSDYAHFGLGLALSRLSSFVLAAEHLSMAVAMRPDRAQYVESLRQVRATIAARREAGLEVR